MGHVQEIDLEGSHIMSWPTCSQNSAKLSLRTTILLTLLYYLLIQQALNRPSAFVLVDRLHPTCSSKSSKVDLNHDDC